MTSNRNRIISLILLLLFSFVILGSSCFIITHTGHDCTGEDCSVCMELAECHKTLNTLGNTFMGGVHIAVMILALSVIVNALIQTSSKHTTLISLKVELLN